MSSRFANGAITGVCLLFSLTSISTLIIWDGLPWLWAILTFVAQVIQAFSSHFPYSKQIVALDYLVPQVDELLLQIESQWRKIEDYNDKKLDKLIDNFKEQFNNLETRFTANVYLPERNRCTKKAEYECKSHFKQHYNVEE